ncbi:hypothetical protein ACFX13_007739 [Malus domestica]
MQRHCWAKLTNCGPSVKSQSIDEISLFDFVTALLNNFSELKGKDDHVSVYWKEIGCAVLPIFKSTDDVAPCELFVSSVRMHSFIHSQIAYDRADEK